MSEDYIEIWKNDFQSTLERLMGRMPLIDLDAIVDLSVTGEEGAIQYYFAYTASTVGM